MIRPALVLTVLLLLCVSYDASSQNCCAPAVPQQGVVGETVALPHVLSLTCHFEYLRGRGLHDSSGYVANPRNTTADWHRMTFAVSYGILPRLSATMIVPFVWKNKEFDLDLAQKGVVHKQLDGNGLSDVTVMARFSLIPRSFVNYRELSVGGGVKLPTGATDRVDEIQDTLAPELQPGTGSWDYLGSISFYQGYDLFDVMLSATYVRTMSHQGYEFGNQFSYLVSSVVHAKSWLDVGIGLSGSRLGKDYEENREGKWKKVPNTGRHQLWIAPGVQVQVIPEVLRLHFVLEEPVYQHFKGIQLASDYNLRITAAFSLLLKRTDEG